MCIFANLKYNVRKIEFGAFSKLERKHRNITDLNLRLGMNFQVSLFCNLDWANWRQSFVFRLEPIELRQIAFFHPKIQTRYGRFTLKRKFEKGNIKTFIFVDFINQNKVLEVVKQNYNKANQFSSEGTFLLWFIWSLPYKPLYYSSPLLIFNWEQPLHHCGLNVRNFWP